ncbi:MAG TPA: M56 family metallopeptidase [Leptolyngbyaceae cyanobacterium]
MHSSLILLVIGLAIWLRWQWQPTQGDWHRRWQLTLLAFCLPPLLLLTTAVAVLEMGHHGAMLGLPVEELGCWVATAILLGSLSMLAYRLGREVRFYFALRTYPKLLVISNEGARCLPNSLPFAAQVGLWKPQLIVSQGLLTHLDPAELEAVLVHEQAHEHYRDPFWFFWLGWLRQLTLWLPNTNALWQELLLLREMRADRRAAEQVDPLLLAEILVKLVALPFRGSAELVAFNQALSTSRLEQRIEALLVLETEGYERRDLQCDKRKTSGWKCDRIFQSRPFQNRSLSWLLLSLLPLATVLLHKVH